MKSKKYNVFKNIKLYDKTKTFFNLWGEEVFIFLIDLQQKFK